MESPTDSCGPASPRQLARRRTGRDGRFTDHALTRVVRLTIETNVLTSKLIIVSGVLLASIVFFFLFLATVGIASLLTVAIFPVGVYYQFRVFRTTDHTNLS